MARKTAPKKKRPAFPLLDHIDDLMAKLQDLLPAALEQFDADAIHQSRVSTRRLKAALDLMGPVLSKRHQKPLAEGLKKLRRRLGPLRDADVMIDALTELEKGSKHPAGSAWLRQRLEVDRDALRDASRDGPSAKKELKRVEGWPLVRAEIVEAREAIDSLLAESLHLQTDAFAEQADRLAAGAKGDDRPNPHDVRIAGKALRYTLEMADAEGHSPGAGVMKSFKKMQELLGTWHDHVVLADTALAAVVDAELAHLDVAAAEQAIDLAKFAVRRSAQELAAFEKCWRQQGAGLAAKIRASFPLTQPAAQPPADAAVTTDVGGPADAEPPEADDDAADAANGSAVTESRTDPDPVGSVEPTASEGDPSSESPAA